MRDHALQELFEVAAGDLGARSPECATTRASAARLIEERIELALVLDVGLGLAALDAEQRRLRDVDVAVLDDRRQLPVEERQQAASGCAIRRRPRRS